MKRILLITPVDFQKNGAGQQYLKSLVSLTPSLTVVTMRMPVGGYLEFNTKDGQLKRVIKSISSRISLLQNLNLYLYRIRQVKLDLSALLKKI